MSNHPHTGNTRDLMLSNEIILLEYPSTSLSNFNQILESILELMILELTGHMRSIYTGSRQLLHDLPVNMVNYDLVNY